VRDSVTPDEGYESVLSDEIKPVQFILGDPLLINQAVPYLPEAENAGLSRSKSGGILLCDTEDSNDKMADLAAMFEEIPMPM